MTSTLSIEFKSEVVKPILNNAKKLITEYFDKNKILDARNCLHNKPPQTIYKKDEMKVQNIMFFTNGKPKTISIVNEQMIVEISRQCFGGTSYFEDYHVNFITTINNKKIQFIFYLEWKNNDMNTELICPNEKKIKVYNYK